MKSLTTLFVVFVGGLAISAHSQNLLRNPDFEAVPNGTIGQGILPSEWIAVNPSPDTYSHDGSYGLAPSDFNNFPGVVAHSGIRWVAGWNGVPETFGQVMTSPLVGGRRYELSCFLHQSLRPDLNNPGTYEVTLRQPGLPNRMLGRFPSTVSAAEGWVNRRFEFAAPADAGLYQTVAFEPKPTSSLDCYPGMDLIALLQVGEAVPIHVTLEGWATSPSSVSVVLEVRNIGSTIPLETHAVALDEAGNGFFYTDLTGTFDLTAKAPHWLRKLMPEVVLNAGTSFDLVNGDSDEDNEVAIGDFAIISAAYNSCVGDPKWDSRADLNGDGCTDIGDYAILSANYGRVGD